MVLASTQSDMPINELAWLAIKNLIIEVAIPQVTNVSVRLSFSELESLPAKIISLKQQITSLLAMPVHHIIAIWSAQLRPVNHLMKFVGIT